MENITPARIVEACRTLPVTSTSTETEDEDSSSLAPAISLQESDVIVSFAIMHLGMKEKNPLDFIKFYSKNDPTRKFFFYTRPFLIFSSIKGAHNAQRGDYSGLMPQWFAEDLLRVYTKKPQFFGLVQAGYRAVLAKMEFDLAQTSDTMALTPPATEAPCTPRAESHSRNASFTFPTAPGLSTTPFSNNSFTTVPSSFVPGSPTRSSKKRRGGALSGKWNSPSRHGENPKKKQKQ